MIYAGTAIDLAERIISFSDLKNLTNEAKETIHRAAVTWAELDANHALRPKPKPSGAAQKPKKEMTASDPIQEDCPDCATPEQEWQHSFGHFAGDAIAMSAYWTQQFGEDWQTYGVPSSFVTLAEQAAEAWADLKYGLQRRARGQRIADLLASTRDRALSVDDITDHAFVLTGNAPTPAQRFSATRAAVRILKRTQDISMSMAESSSTKRTRAPRQRVALTATVRATKPN